MSKWQPIETAPKDGAVVLVHPGTWQGLSASPAKYDSDRYKNHPNPFWKRTDAMNLVYKSRENPPTHWMPLPEPPEVEE